MSRIYIIVKAGIHTTSRVCIIVKAGSHKVKDMYYNKGWHSWHAQGLGYVW